MKILTGILLWALLNASSVLLAGTDRSVQISNNFSAMLPDEAGHPTPVVEFLRRLERILRQSCSISNITDSRPLILALSSEQPAGTFQFCKHRQTHTVVLQLPPDIRQWLDSPAIGRALVSGLIQSRLGNPPRQMLPEAALWIADGVWAEFVQREKSGMPILHFTYLDLLRQAAESGFELTLNTEVLTPPRQIRVHSAEWTLYCQRSQLMLETANSLKNQRHDNVIKDYLFLLQGGKLSAQESFSRTFESAAQKKLSLSGETVSGGQSALKIMALRKLFSVYAPMNPQAINELFQQICQVNYQHSSGSFSVTANLSDLPELVEKYESCAHIPRLKIAALNNLAAVSPRQLHPEIFTLSKYMAQIGTEPARRMTEGIKSSIQSLNSKLAMLKAVDSELQQWEKSQQPLLYEHRLVVGTAPLEQPLPPRIKEFFDYTEKAAGRN